MVMLKDFVWLWVRVQHQTRSRCNRMDQRCYNNAKRSLAKERHSNQASAIAAGSPRTTSSFGKKARFVGKTDAEADLFGKLYSSRSNFPPGSPEIVDRRTFAERPNNMTFVFGVAVPNS